MSDDNKEVVDRGDDFVPTSDESGDTDDLNKKDDKSDDAGADDQKDEGKGDKDDESGKDADADDDKDESKDKDEDKDEDIRIPKKRFDQAVAKARKEAEDAQRRAQELEEQLEAQEGRLDLEKIEEQIDKLEDDLEAAIKDGNQEAKARLRKEIRRKNQEIAEAKAAQHAARATAVAIEKITYDALVREVEAQHPELVPDSEEYNQEVVDELWEYKEAFEAKGHGSTEALRKALRAVYGKAPVKPKVDADEDEGEKKDDKKEADKKEADKKAAEAAAKRKEEAVKKGLDTKGKQPADSKKAGMDSDKAGKKGTASDVAKMSDKEYEKLSEEEKARARGDFL